MAIVLDPLSITVLGWVAMLVVAFVGLVGTRFVRPAEQQSFDLQALIEYREVQGSRIEVLEQELLQLRAAIARTQEESEKTNLRNTELTVENSTLRALNAQHQQKIIELQDSLLQTSLATQILQVQRDAIVKRYGIPTRLT